jgi:hypothetical protein
MPALIAVENGRVGGAELATARAHAAANGVSVAYNDVQAFLAGPAITAVYVNMKNDRDALAIIAAAAQVNMFFAGSRWRSRCKVQAQYSSRRSLRLPVRKWLREADALS